MKTVWLYVTVNYNSKDSIYSPTWLFKNNYDPKEVYQ